MSDENKNIADIPYGVTAAEPRLTIKASKTVTVNLLITFNIEQNKPTVSIRYYRLKDLFTCQ